MNRISVCAILILLTGVWTVGFAAPVGSFRFCDEMNFFAGWRSAECASHTEFNEIRIVSEGHSAAGYKAKKFISSCLRKWNNPAAPALQQEKGQEPPKKGKTRKAKAQRLTPNTQHLTPRSVHLVAVGDILLGGPMGLLMEKKGSDYPFDAMRSTLRQADLAFGNLECCVATQGEPIPKKYNFRGNPKFLAALSKAGFDIVSLANNHAWDYGRAALLETVQRVRKAGVRTVGAGRNRAEAHQLQILHKNGLTIGFLAYLGLIPALVAESETKPCLSMAGKEAIRRDVRAARKKADVLIVSLHAGEEGAKEPTPRQKAFAQAAIDAGADMVIGHHPHVTQALVLYHGKPICYSLGNFVFSTEGRGSGALLDATLFSGGRVKARLRPLRLSAQPRFAAD